MAGLWNHLKNIFVCCDQVQEGILNIIPWHRLGYDVININKVDKQSKALSTFFKVIIRLGDVNFSVCHKRNRMVWKGGTICGAVLLFELDKTFELSEEDRHFLQYFTGTTPSKVVFAMEDRGKGLRKDPKQPRCWKWHALCKPIKARVYLFTPPFRQQLYRDKTNELTRLKYKVTNFAKGLSLILYRKICVRNCVDFRIVLLISLLLF